MELKDVKVGQVVNFTYSSEKTYSYKSCKVMKLFPNLYYSVKVKTKDGEKDAHPSELTLVKNVKKFKVGDKVKVQYKDRNMPQDGIFSIIEGDFHQKASCKISGYDYITKQDTSGSWYNFVYESELTLVKETEEFPIGTKVRWSYTKCFEYSSSTPNEWVIVSETDLDKYDYIIKNKDGVEKLAYKKELTKKISEAVEEFPVGTKVTWECPKGCITKGWSIKGPDSYGFDYIITNNNNEQKCAYRTELKKEETKDGKWTKDIYYTVKTTVETEKFPIGTKVSWTLRPDKKYFVIVKRNGKYYVLKDDIDVDPYYALEQELKVVLTNKDIANDLLNKVNKTLTDGKKYMVCSFDENSILVHYGFTDKKTAEEVVRLHTLCSNLTNLFVVALKPEEIVGFISDRKYVSV